ncbi:hypothetical protein AVEN_51074-1, partial [Araneus ventricosus]
PPPKIHQDPLPPTSGTDIQHPTLTPNPPGGHAALDDETSKPPPKNHEDPLPPT